ncbi:MAG: aminoacyl-tRNA hydrolase [Erysipelotrichales bacterium]|nr:aminoacyl-tRNA hydrolase [Erysipelotrichales bacterium]
MKLIVGLGNPGREYENTRHNMGFKVIDKFADSLGVDIDKSDFKGLFCRTKFYDEDIYLLKPQTFMNLSGQSVLAFINYFKIDIEDVIVIYDDLALSPGKIRLRLSGSSGGQKGMQNIIDLLKTDQIKRIRIGIGEPTYGIIDYVLGKPSKDEQVLIDEAQDKAVNALKEILKKDFHSAMSKYN